ncbi:hypothetical protein GCM10009584_17970 [Ornithinimicrobium humiphilum]|uniref:Uncharacterized protein n=1 Tax=Ornithinimicrobium humiphilum TaxID=125288 RepID=A0A543KLB6_9MICO|nr:hypothetical protein [Ornithinimicrobium humiphilum]TQM95889.1 hypothetical protein FB476_0739 [Ornithinimicrobium humiphilum]
MTFSPDHATDLLRQLDDDRSRLADLTATPWWAPAFLGLVVGLWVASPAVGDRTSNYVFALVAAVVIVSVVRARTGIRLRAAGARQVSLGALWLLATLVLYSVSLALVSLDRSVWVVLPALGAAATTWAAARVSDRWAREALRA